MKKAKPPPTPPPPPPLTAKQRADLLLQANQRNLAAKLKGGKTLSAREVSSLEAIRDAGEKGVEFIPGDIVPGMNQAAAVLGVTRSVVREAKRQGCLAFKANNNVHVPTLKKWLADNDVQPDDTEPKHISESRLAKGRADLVDLKVAEKRRTLIPDYIMRRAFTHAIISFKTRMLAIPDNIAQRYAVLTDPVEIREDSRRLIIEALDELSKCDWAREVPK